MMVGMMMMMKTAMALGLMKQFGQKKTKFMLALLVMLMLLPLNGLEERIPI